VSVRAPAPGAVEIRISDNGAAGGGPFSENAGMALTRRRAEEIGAGIEYQSTSDGGTAVAIRLGSGLSRSDGGDVPREDPASQEVEGDGEARPAT
jgi:nitrate/nitrite-specific signal transduction histidine kinase